MLKDVLVVTKHQGALEWLSNQKNIEVTEVIRHVTSLCQVRDRIVIGILPMRFAAQTRMFGSIYVPKTPVSRRGQELTNEEMMRYKARIEWYKVCSIQSPDTEEEQ